VLVVEDFLIDGADGRTFLRICDNDEVIPVLISTIRGLDGDFEALLNHLWLHRPAEVKAPPHRPRRGQQVIDSSAIHVLISSGHGWSSNVTLSGRGASAVSGGPLQRDIGLPRSLNNLIRPQQQ
jgi:hypothetical protein